MLAALLLPTNTTLDYTGLPQFAAATPIEVRGHTVTIRVQDETVTIESTTEVRNHGDTGSATILIPRRRMGDDASGQPGFTVEATWDRTPVTFAPVADQGTSERVDAKTTRYASDLSGTVTLGKEATHALRLKTVLPLGRTGSAPQRRIVGYLLEGGGPIVTLNVAFKYGPPTVFNLPTAAPDWGWQIGKKGAFAQRKNFTPAGEVATIEFYKGGFNP